MSAEVVMPQLGQAMVTGVVIAWHVRDGADVVAGELLLTIESDKSAFDIEAQASGTVRHRIAEGQEADVGAVLGTIGVANTSNAAPANQGTSPATSPLSPPNATKAHGSTKRSLATPKAKMLAKEHGIDLAAITASGEGGIVSADDVKNAIAAQPEAASAKGEPIGAAHRSAINRLQKSWSQAPHIVQMIDVDATALVRAQDAIRGGVLSATLNDIIIQAAADTLHEFSDINAYIDGDRIIHLDKVNVSIAVATDRGLRTPTLENVAGRTLDEIAPLTRNAIEASRTGRGKAARASLTISNLGRYGIRSGTPVLNLDEPILIFIGAITERAAVQGGQLVVRPEMTLSIAYDHRIVDGLRAAEFSSALRQRLENFTIAGTAETEAHPLRKAELSSRSGLRCELRQGRHRWVIDEPQSIGGSDTGPDPVTSVLGALLSCMTIAFKLVAQRRKVDITRIEGMIDTVPEGKVQDVQATLEVWSSAPRDKVEALLKPAKSACYVHDMLRPDMKLAIELIVHGAP
tara:strand:+ start:8261 stop:9817 length:1557 start_codon:yes stop_codon:yes gene_type:complete